MRRRCFRILHIFYGDGNGGCGVDEVRWIEVLAARQLAAIHAAHRASHAVRHYCAELTHGGGARAQSMMRAGCRHRTAECDLREMF